MANEGVREGVLFVGVSCHQDHLRWFDPGAQEAIDGSFDGGKVVEDRDGDAPDLQRTARRIRAVIHGHLAHW
jgi:hypothetical protein